MPRLRRLSLSAALTLAVGCRNAPAPAPAAETTTAADVSAPSPDDAPYAEARTVDVPGDLPVFYVAGRRNTTERMVFLHGACTHGLGYIQAFQTTARTRGSLMALQGEHDCGRGMRSWSWDLEKLDARIDAGFRAARDERAGPIVAIGYSQGALVAEKLAAKYPSKYRRIILMGAPRTADARSLTKLEGAVLMAGTFDNRAVMKEGVAALTRTNVPATFIEIPNARHGALLEGERIMDEAFTWLQTHAKGATGNEATAREKPEKLEPLRANWLETLDLGNGDQAVVSVPMGATEPRPLMLAMHGAGDRHDWACGGWRLGNDAYPFIVCPRGTPMGGNVYAWSSAEQIERLGLQAIEEVRRRYGSYVATTPVTYAGFSQGATAAAPFLVRRASEFPTILLAEGAYASTASPDFARRLARGGVQRVVLVCGTGHCFENARRARPVLERAGLTVFVGGDASSGHNLNLPMQRALRRSWKPWFDGVPGWSQFPE
ncbi:alpha/beta hydrolase [Pendulispora rubella]|uniref:Alpha/beta hydrolase n=1 Tax=Pendulispora rubella TaxID=2741070 RepID=A0ABZ2KQ96_9BACT